MFGVLHSRSPSLTFVLYPSPNPTIPPDHHPFLFSNLPLLASYDTACAACRDAMNEAVLFCGRYKLIQKVHISSTAVVWLACRSWITVGSFLNSHVCEPAMCAAWPIHDPHEIDTPNPPPPKWT